VVSWSTRLRTVVRGKKVSSLKGEELVKVEKKWKREKMPLTCYNCSGWGHTSRQCPSESIFCGTRRYVGYYGSKKLIRQPFYWDGFVEGQFVNDTVLDTGCSRA